MSPESIAGLKIPPEALDELKAALADARHEPLFPHAVVSPLRQHEEAPAESASDREAA